MNTVYMRQRIRRHATKKVAVLTILSLIGTLGCTTNRAISGQIDDAAITTKVESKLAADPQVNNFEIDVDTIDGKVRLSGLVETETERQTAETIARETDGVREVDNDLELGDLTTGENANDALILSKVKAKLTADPQVNPFDIDVDVTGGVVTLSGTVDNPEERAEAEKLARATEGVKDVRNLLSIGSS